MSIVILVVCIAGFLSMGLAIARWIAFTCLIVATCLKPVVFLLIVAALVVAYYLFNRFY